VGGGEREEGVAERRERAQDCDRDYSLHFGVGWNVGEFDRWKEGVGDERWEGGEDGGLRLRRRRVGGHEESDAEVVVTAESLGEVNHWNEMSHTRAWHHGYHSFQFP